MVNVGYCFNPDHFAKFAKHSDIGPDLLRRVGITADKFKVGGSTLSLAPDFSPAEIFPMPTDARS